MGPFATQILADQGADVIVVESGDGDMCRVMGPGPHAQLSGIALNLLRNKRSIEVDLKSPQGRSIVERLVATCDVVVTTMRPDALERLGVDYATLAAIRSDVIYCQAQGFPLASERANEPAYDDVIQAACGASELMERVTGDVGLIPTILADKVCGLVIAQAVAAALFHRERTGEGQHIEVPMVQAFRSFMLVEHGSGAISEPPVHAPGFPPAGYPRVLNRERRPQRSKDGLVHLFPYLPKHFAAIFEDATDPRYADERAANANSESLNRDLRALGPTRTTAEWLAFCRERGVPATEVASLQDMVDELPLVDHPVTGPYRATPQLANFSRTQGALRHHAPLIGEHTDEVLAEIDYVEQH